MTDDETNSPWLCHVCDYSSTVGSGQVCSRCYKIACSRHITITTSLNPDSGLYELQPVCAECQFRDQI